MIRFVSKGIHRSKLKRKGKERNDRFGEPVLPTYDEHKLVHDYFDYGISY